jgi:hypothetical protein
MTNDDVAYFAKLFTYICSQAEEDSLIISEGLTAIGQHPWGDHDHCSSTWCRHKDDPA